MVEFLNIHPIIIIFLHAHFKPLYKLILSLFKTLQKYNFLSGLMVSKRVNNLVPKLDVKLFKVFRKC